MKYKLDFDVISRGDDDGNYAYVYVDGLITGVISNERMEGYTFYVHMLNDVGLEPEGLHDHYKLETSDLDEAKTKLAAYLENVLTI